LQKDKDKKILLWRNSENQRFYQRLQWTYRIAVRRPSTDRAFIAGRGCLARRTHFDNAQCRLRPRSVHASTLLGSTTLTASSAGSRRPNHWLRNANAASQKSRRRITDPLRCTPAVFGTGKALKERFDEKPMNPRNQQGLSFMGILTGR
jgi:hypothetical protein